jgi:riboflavin synthase
MFTGIVTDRGTVRSAEERGSGRRLVIAAAPHIASAPVGASIACSGVCLTVAEKGADCFAADVSSTTLAHTGIAAWREGTRINLERALAVGDELGGHFVTGHVDSLITITALRHEGEARLYTLSCPQELLRFIVPRGSVALDGVSLTVTEQTGRTFGVTLIPHTLSVTTWGERKPGDTVHLEVDLLARYVAGSQNSELRTQK